VLTLRILLFSGLVLHKIIWEALKRSAGAEQKSARKKRPPSVLALKAVKLLVLVFILVQTLTLDILPITDDPGALRAVGVALYAVGLATAIAGRMQLGRNWVDFEDYTVLKNQSLVAEGVYRYVRHPIYTGDIFLLLGLELALNSWLVLAVAVLFVVVYRQAAAEEKVLAATIPGYDEYCSRTKRFIPYVI